VVPFAASEALEQMLRAANGTVQRLGFAGGHGIDPGLFPAMRAVLEAGWS
jgi:predicted esterase